MNAVISAWIEALVDAADQPIFAQIDDDADPKRHPCAAGPGGGDAFDGGAIGAGQLLYSLLFLLVTRMGGG
jgi:hypothetical protein